MKTKRVVVFVDVQNDFVKGGALAYGYPSNDIVPRIAEYARHCRDEGDTIFFTMDTHWKDTYLDSLEGKKLPVPHCIDGPHGWELVPSLKDILVGGRSPFLRAFAKTTFGCQMLPEVVKDVRDERGGLDEIVIVGGCTSICVMAQAVLLRAAFPNTPITVKAKLCFDIDEASHNAALAVLKNQQIDVVGE